MIDLYSLQKDLTNRPLDCYGLVRFVADKYFSIAYPELDGYLVHPKSVVFNQLETGSWVHIDYSDRRPGDVVTLAATPGTAGHVGIVIDSTHILHLDQRYGAIIQTEAGLKLTPYLYRKVYRWLK